MGSGGIIALANDNFLIVSPSEDNGALDAAGSVSLVNSDTGYVIKTITGDTANDQLASGGITLLNDNRFVITSPNYQSDGKSTGSVQVIDVQGNPINSVYGNTYEFDNLGNRGVKALDNNNFVVVTANSQPNAIMAQLVNSSGEVIESIIGTDAKASKSFDVKGIIPLKNGNFLIASPTYYIGRELANVGAVQLVNGSTGEPISMLVGDKRDGYLGKTQGVNRGDGRYTATTIITPLGNSNYVVLDHTDAGSVRLFSGANGEQIGETVVGQVKDDFENRLFFYNGLNRSNKMTEITALNNNNYVISAGFSDHLGKVNAGICVQPQASAYTVMIFI